MKHTKHHDLDETCPLQGYYAEYSGNSLPTFRDNLSVQYSTVKKLHCPETSVRPATIRCVISQTSADLIHFAVDA